MIKISLIDTPTGAHISFTKCRNLSDVVWFVRQYQDLIRNGARVMIYPNYHYYELTYNTNIGIVMVNGSWPVIKTRKQLI